MARELLKKTDLMGEEVLDIISKTWEEMGGGEQEIFIENQRSEDNGRLGESGGQNKPKNQADQDYFQLTFVVVFFVEHFCGKPLL